MNGNIFAPEIEGVDGVINAYTNAIKNSALYGPTNFASIISEINDHVSHLEVSQEKQKYHILVILTDGAISDMR